MKRLHRILAILMLMTILTPSVIQAQETTPESQSTTLPATELPSTPLPETNPVIPADPATSELDGILTIIAAIGLIIVVGGSLALAYRGQEIAGISVPQQVTNNINEQIIGVMKTTMEEIGRYVQATPTPMDDAVFAIGRVPIEKLIEELTGRAMTHEDSNRVYAAIRQTLDIDDTIPDTGAGDTDNPLASL